MNKIRHPLGWSPPGKIRRGRLLSMSRRTVEEEMKKMGKIWNEISWLAQDRDDWRRLVDA